MVDLAAQDMRMKNDGASPKVRLRLRKTVPSWVISAVTIGVLMLLWEYFGRDVNPILGSYPSAIAIAGWEMLLSGELTEAMLESIQPFVVGFILAMVLGVPLGMALGRFRIVEAAIGLLVTGGYAMPLVALVPLLVLWLGLGFGVKVAIISLMCVFPIAINTWLGVKVVSKSLIEVGRAFVAPDIVILRRIVLPATLPYIVAGVKLAVGRGVVAMVIAEFFTAISGLGGIIINSANNFETARMFVPIVVIMVLAILLNALVGFIERWVAPWQIEMAARD